MFHIAICDDEKYFRQSIKEFVSDYLQRKGILYQIDMFSFGGEFLSLGIEMTKYTVVFLDINMAEKNGIAVAKEIRTLSREIFIVFVTAFYDYTLEGYKVDAIRYLIKDNDHHNFQNVIDECMDSIIEKMNYIVVSKKFGFKEGTKEISLEKLIYIESNLHKLSFHVMEKKQTVYTLYETLDELEKKLEGNSFIRLHQSYLVNLKHVKNVSRYKATLNNKVELVIPKIRYMYVKEAFIAYQGEI